MKDYTQRRLELFREKFPNKLGEVIDDFGSTVKSDIVDFLSTSIAQAEQEVAKKIEKELLHQKECIFLGIQKEFIKKILSLPNKE